MSERASIHTPDGEMPGQLWLPAGGSGPGVVLVQEIFGVSSYIERRAQDLADLGYVVVAPEFYWRLGAGKVEGPNAMEEGFGLFQRLDWGAAVADGVSAVAWLRARDEVTAGVGIMGFCLGGGLGFNIAAETEVDALVSYYGSGLPELLGLAPEHPGVPVLEPSQVSAPSLHHFGLADSFIPRPMVEQIQATLTTQDSVTFIAHETGDHAFDNDDFHLYDEETATRAWGQTVDWLAEHLPT